MRTSTTEGQTFTPPRGSVGEVGNLENADALAVTADLRVSATYLSLQLQRSKHRRWKNSHDDSHLHACNLYNAASTGVRGIYTALVRTQRRSRAMHKPSPIKFLRLLNADLNPTANLFSNLDTEIC